jgi:hypothetical protein
VDDCARAELRATEGNAILVTVALPDGRTASRRVERSEDVIPALQALLLVPAPPPPARVATTPQRPTAPSSPLRGAPRTESDLHQLSVSPVAERRLGFELSLLAGARAGDGQLGAGVGVMSLLESSGWLLGFLGRVDQYQPFAGGGGEMALALGLLGGRRLDFGGVALDVTAGPAVATRGIAISETEVVEVDAMAPPPPPPEAEPGPEPRLLVGARLGFTPRSVFRTFIGLDGELGPSLSTSKDELPGFAAGVVFGATVGTR